MPEKKTHTKHNYWGRVEKIKISNIKKTSSKKLHESWLNIPHVTQFDYADITDLEDFRKIFNNKNRNIKLTIIVFVIKAISYALKKHPIFNSSFDQTNEHIILKKYFNISIAINTLKGIVTPVLYNIDKKNILEISLELRKIIYKTNSNSLKREDFLGSCITISNLGGFGGGHFTPIINRPEVSIIGLSKILYKPVYSDGKFIPRLFLPISLSYDHRIINGVDGINFLKNIIYYINDVRRFAL